MNEKNLSELEEITIPSIIRGLEEIDAELDAELAKWRASLARSEAARRLSVFQLVLAGLALVLGVATLALMPREPAGAEQQGPMSATTTSVATTTTVGEVGLIPAACASVDPVAFPCPAETEVGSW